MMIYAWYVRRIINILIAVAKNNYLLTNVLFVSFTNMSDVFFQDFSVQIVAAIHHTAPHNHIPAQSLDTNVHNQQSRTDGR